MKKKLLSTRVWILIVVLLLSVLAINPNPYREGIEISNVKAGSAAAQNGLVKGMLIKSINGQQISSLSDFNRVVSEIEIEPVKVDLVTNSSRLSYFIETDIGFSIDNLTIIDVRNINGLNLGETVKEINGVKVENQSQFNEVVNELIPKSKIEISTDKGKFIFLAGSDLGISVKKASKNNLVKGLDLEGGTRVLIQPEGDKIDDRVISDLIKVMSNRLNIYGLADVKVRGASDLSGNKFVLVELAGIDKEEVKDIIEQQGKFEAKIGNETVFIGGNRDIPFVCRNDGSCSGVRDCRKTEGGYFCGFAFSIKLSSDAAKRHANITSDLDAVLDENGREYLSKNLDFYLDDELVNSLNIGADLKGSETIDIEISGSGSGVSEEEAFDSAMKEMDNLQTVLITGSLPLKINIVKMDSISPVLGQEFVKNAFFVGFLALVAVGIVIYIRYRSLKIAIPMIITSLSEVVIILGFAAISRWNLDLAAIAGVIAAVGTGVDDQIVIVDEVLKGKERFFNWKDRIKGAFFIIIVAYATTFAAMLPLGWAGAGLVRGFAVITIVGITIGVFLTRPAFASMIEKLLNK